jgi:hypothetical protein
MNSQEKAENSMVLSNPILYPVEISVRLDWPSLSMLDKIAMYEREKRATMARRILIEKIQTYERNPSFKRFLKQLEEQKQQDRSRKPRRAGEL